MPHSLVRGEVKKSAPGGGSIWIVPAAHSSENHFSLGCGQAIQGGPCDRQFSIEHGFLHAIGRQFPMNGIGIAGGMGRERAQVILGPGNGPVSRGASDWYAGCG